VICDDIICSSDVAALKADDPQAFFGPWLDRHGLGFPDAVLIDDRADDYTSFTACGGTAIRWKMGANDISALKSWLDTERPHPGWDEACPKELLTWAYARLGAGGRCWVRTSDLSGVNGALFH
jgi:hypothetical protein